MSKYNSIENINLAYYQKNRHVILNRAKDYHEHDKERLREQPRDKYRNLSEEEKNKKREYGKKWISQEYQKSYREAKKSIYNNFLILI